MAGSKQDSGVVRVSTRAAFERALKQAEREAEAPPVARLPGAERAPDPAAGDAFDRLPPEVRRRVEAYWSERDERDPAYRRRRRREFGRCAAEGGVLLAVLCMIVCGVLFGGQAGAISFAVGLPVGAVAGMSMLALRVGRFGAMLFGVAGFVTVLSLAGGFGRIESIVVSMLFCGLWGVANAFAIYGVRLEARRLEGWE